MTQQLIDEFKELVSLLFPVPTVAVEVLNYIQSGKLDIKPLAQIIYKDQVLVGDVIRSANSPVYGLKRRIQNVTDAITVLGFEALRNVVWTSVLSGMLKNKDTAPFCLSVQAFWKHSLAVAQAMKEYALKAGKEPLEVENFYLTGLMHDVGKIALTAFYEKKQKRRLKANAFCDIVAERRELILTHPQAGAIVLKSWEFPKYVIKAVYLHHESPLSSDDELTATLKQYAHFREEKENKEKGDEKR